MVIDVGLTGKEAFAVTVMMQTAEAYYRILDMYFSESEDNHKFAIELMQRQYSLHASRPEQVDKFIQDAYYKMEAYRLVREQAEMAESSMNNGATGGQDE